MKTGLFGGTFSPPHNGHVRAAKLFVEAAGLDRLIVMPAGTPPHKAVSDGAGDADRLQMSRLAFKLAFGDFVEVSDYEMGNEGKSYTVDTLKYLKSIYPDDELYMLIGEDMLVSLEDWRSPDEICSLATVAYIRRKKGEIKALAQTEEKYRRKWGAEFLCIGAEPLEISSTLVRERLKSGDADELIPVPVGEYIKEHGLYK